MAKIMKKIIIIQARMNARRFPGKVLKNLLDKPVLQWVVDAASKVSLIDDVVVATSDQNVDQAIVSWCSAQNIKVFQGNESDVLTRYYEAAKHMKADLIVRITADCPLLDPNIVEQIVYLVSEGYADYASNVLPATWPDGLDCEAFTFKALETAFLEAKRLSDREHVTSFIRNNQHRFKTLNIVSPIPGIQKHRWNSTDQWTHRQRLHN
jgi:spore coat polysaccharide biosynthesis protein SpsF (cytidylyltransferase family)